MSLERRFKQEEFADKKASESEEQGIAEPLCRTCRRDVNEQVVDQPHFREFVNELGDCHTLAMKEFLLSRSNQSSRSKMEESCQAWCSRMSTM